MKLSELVASIESNPNTISVEQCDDYGSYLFLRVRYITSTEDATANEEAICILVKDRGLPTETAYVKGTYPRYLKQSPFRTELNTAISNFIAENPNIEKYKFVYIDDDNSMAEIMTYVYDTENNVTHTVRWVVYKVNGEIVIRKIE